jgi:hypothetical protein
MTAQHMSEAAVARRSHSIASAVRQAIRVWYALLGGIAAWTIHLMFLVSWVRYTCNAHGYVWAMHLATLVTLAMTAAAMVLSWRLVKAGGGDNEADDTEGGRSEFIGRLGLLIGAANFALIAVEGLYVFVLASRRCG